MVEQPATRLTVSEKRAHSVGPGFYRHPSCGCLLSLPTWRQRLGEWAGRRFAHWMERGFGYGRFRNGLATGPPRDIAVDVRVTRVMSSTDNSRPVRLTVTDKASNLQFLEIRFTLAEWADVVTGQGSYDGAEAHVGGLHHVGKLHEHQSKTFGGHRSQDFGEAEAQAWCAAMLAEGWDTAQTHRNNMAQTVAVARRYVEPDACLPAVSAGATSDRA